MVSRIKEIIESFRAGEEESAFFALIDLDGDVLPALIEVFRQEREPYVRAFLVKAAWERRNEAVIPFLGEVVNGAEEEAWQQALDGLVTFASMNTLEILEQARSRQFINEPDGRRFRLWLAEAIDQVRDVIKR